MNQYKRLSQRVILVGFANILVFLSGIILLPILTKNMSIEDYGIWAQISVTIMLIPGIATLGLKGSLIRYIPSMKNKEDIQDILYSSFFIVLIASFLSSICVYYFSEIISISLFGGNNKIVQILALIVFLEPLNALSLHYFKARIQIKKFSTLLVSNTIIKIVFVGFFVLNGYEILGAIFGLLLSTIVLFMINIFLIFKDIGTKIPMFANIKEHIFFGLPTIPGNLADWVVKASDRYVIGFLLGAAFVGYYSPGYMIGGVVNIFIAPLNMVLPMVLSKHYDNDDNLEVEQILSYALKYFIGISIPSIIGLSLMSKNILYVLSTPEIAAQSYLITPFSALSMLFYGFFIIFGKTMLLEKKTKILGKAWIFSAIINLFLNFTLVPYIGIMGAAIATLVSFAVVSLYIITKSMKVLNIYFNTKFTLKCIVASAIMGILIYYINPQGIGSIFLTVISGAIFYFATLILLNGFTNKELIFLKNVVRK